jgi:hypothetical protein
MTLETERKARAEAHPKYFRTSKFLSTTVAEPSDNDESLEPLPHAHNG